MATVTEPSTAVEEQVAGSLLDLRHRITVEEYHRMAAAEVFGPEPRVELLEGVIVEKMTKNPPHLIAADLLDNQLHRLLPPGYVVSMGNPVTIEERDSGPEPDVMVLRGHPRDFSGRRRKPGDAVLVIEVADTSYPYDRHQKWVTYAGSRVVIYWILDLNRQRLEVHTAPSGQGDSAYFARIETFGPDDQVTLILDGCEVARFAVREILP